MKHQEKAEYIYDILRHYIWGDTLVLNDTNTPEYRFVIRNIISTMTNNNIIIAQNDKNLHDVMESEYKENKNIHVIYMDIKDEKNFGVKVYTKIGMNCALWLYPEHMNTTAFMNIYNMLQKYGMLCLLIDKKKTDDDMLSDLVFHSGFEELRRFSILRLENAPIKMIEFLDKFGNYKKGNMEVIILAKRNN